VGKHEWETNQIISSNVLGTRKKKKYSYMKRKSIIIPEEHA
jgi:hypothetical protein